MSLDAVIYVVVALAIALAALVLLTFLYFQRRRQRAMLLLALAQEEAERRRRKKKKVALRRWEIDRAAPEGVVYRVAAQPAQHKLTLQSNPEQYADAVAALRSAGHLPPEQPNHAASIQPSVTEPPPASTDTDATTTNQLPQVLLAVPTTETNCVICLEPITVGHRVRALPCNHLYHSQCIRVWLRRKNACPCCCNRVLTRKRKRSNLHAPLAIASDRPVTLEPTSPTRRDDRGENNALQHTLSRDKSSFLSRQSDDTSLERYNSDTTSQMDEHNTADLLSQVRSALRGQSSMLSIDTACSTTPSDVLLASNQLPASSELLGVHSQRAQRAPLPREQSKQFVSSPCARNAADALRTDTTWSQATAASSDAITPSPHSSNLRSMPASGTEPS
eukprot:TRINITY_DN1802_c0_g1_i1.p1 TRINITY_DN1802_c0_g1~~TRINITY_DN1802_c0_g1_i1.p1  ORF type:complete len:391 (+),score=56.14 TRINITY_DN1802_c0_g1_i1:432-1604(+)